MGVEKQKWNIAFEKQPELRTYRIFKSEFKLEDYIHKDLSLSKQSILAQLRCGILPLRIETDRYEGKAEAEKLCKFCGNNSVESEAHFLFQRVCKLLVKR